MLTENTPIKYHLGMWKSLPGYPTSSDFLFEVTSYLEKNSRTGEFTEQTFNAAIGPKWRDTHERVFGELLESGDITTEVRGDKTVYRVKNNPFA
jgi:hypothetical protein